MDNESIKRLLKSSYQDGSQIGEIEEALNQLLNPEINPNFNQYVNILNQIVIVEDDVHLKAAAICQIRRMDVNIIFQSLHNFCINLSPAYHYITNILSDYLAQNYPDIVIKFITSQQDQNVFMIKLKMQLYDSISDKVNQNDDCEFFKQQFKCIKNLIFGKDEIDTNRFQINDSIVIILDYFLHAFSNAFFANESDFIHFIACTFLKNKIDINGTNVIGKALKKYHCQNEPEKFMELLECFDFYYRETKIFKIEICRVFTQFFSKPKLVEFSPDVTRKILIEYLFQFFIINPENSENLELFLDKYHQNNGEIENDIYLAKISFNALCNSTLLYNIVFQFAFEFSNQYFNEPLMMYSLLNFMCSFVSNRSPMPGLTQKFVNEIVFRLMVNCPIPSILSGGICNFLYEVTFNSEFFPSVIRFIKNCILSVTQFSNFEAQLSSYFGIYCLSKLLTKNVCKFFTAEEAKHIFQIAFNFNHGINALHISLAFNIIVKYFTPPNEINDILDETCKNIFFILDDLLISHDDRNSKLSFYTNSLQLIYDLPSNKHKEQTFPLLMNFIQTIFENPKIEEIIDLCFNSLSNFLIFLTERTQDFRSFKLLSLLFIKILRYISCMDLDEIIEPLSTFAVIIIGSMKQNCDQEEFQFLWQFLCDIFELISEKTSEDTFEFTFEALPALLIKFKGQASVYEVISQNYFKITELRWLAPECKCEFHAAFISANPSIIFFCSDEEFNTIINETQIFENSIFLIHVFAVKEIIVFYQNYPNNSLLRSRFCYILNKFNSFLQSMMNNDIEVKLSDYEGDAGVFLKYNIFKETGESMLAYIITFMRNFS